MATKKRVNIPKHVRDFVAGLDEVGKALTRLAGDCLIDAIHCKALGIVALESAPSIRSFSPGGLVEPVIAKKRKKKK